MFNTDEFQSHPNHYMQKTEYIKKNTNNRYRFFRQIHFTAGDYEQFLQYWDRTNSSTPAMDHPYHQTIHPNCSLELYHSLCSEDVFHTFEYIFNKFKKGTFFKLVDGMAKVFLPFSKVDYKNEWSHSINIDHTKYKNVTEMMRYIAGLEQREFSETRIHTDVRSWYGNNGLVRLEYPISEGDSGANMIKDMLECLVRERNLPPCEVFINKRDFPILKKNQTEPYDVFFGPDTPLLSHSYKKYAPILSMITTDEHADIPIPTWEDWCRVSYGYDKRLFAKEFRTYPSNDDFDAIKWEGRIPTAVFRGASTGLGTTIQTNPRLYYSWLSSCKKTDDDGILFLDAGITKWNLRPRKASASSFLDTVRIDEFAFGLVPPLTPLQQASFKYVLHLPGHSAAYRLSLELCSGSVVLLYPCRYKLWYIDLLEPYVHYVPIDPSDPSDVFIKIKWCKANDEKCKEITRKAREFADKHLTRTAILDYLQDTLWALYKNTGPIVHIPRSIKEIIYEQENEFIRSFYERERKYIASLGSNNIEILKRMVKERHCDKISRSLMYLIMRCIDKSDHQDHKDVRMKSSKVELVDIGGCSVVKKQINDGSKHEIAVAYMHGNFLAETVPNFVYTYLSSEWYLDKDPLHVYMEHVKGSTMEDVLMDPRTTIQDVIHIFMDICVALQHAQNICGFMHMDLYPWNIVMKKFTKPIKATYKVGRDECIQITTTDIPVFIDYGRSHVVFSGRHYYNVSPFRISSIQDIVSIVFSSFHIFLSYHKLSHSDIRHVMNVMNFFISDYMPREHLKTMTSLKIFLRDKKKFSNMLIDDKTQLNNLTPMNFFDHLKRLKICNSNTFTICSLPEINPLHYYLLPDFAVPAVFYTILLEAVFYLENVEINSEECKRVSSELINSVRALKASNQNIIIRKIVHWCLAQISQFVDHDTSLVINSCLSVVKKLNGKSSCLKIVRDQVDNIPLLMSHVFMDPAINPVVSKTGDEWIEVFSALALRDVNGFDLQTRSFRNFCLNEWRNKL